MEKSLRSTWSDAPALRRWLRLLSAAGVVILFVAGGLRAEDGPALGQTLPSESIDISRRPPAEGEWMPTILLPNDLTDPPRNYPQCVGGACFGMSTLTYALWCCPRVEGVMTLDDFSANAIHTLLPKRNGRYINHALSTHVLLDGKRTPISDQAALVRIAENVHNTIQPGGGSKKSPEKVRQVFNIALRLPNRISTFANLTRSIELAGGRLNMGVLYFNRDKTEMAGHSVIFTLGRDGHVYVWDPNAEMTDAAVGSGQLAPLKYQFDRDGRIQEVRYRIDLPDGRPQRRIFTFVFPATSFIGGRRLPPLPRLPIVRQ